MSTSRSEPHPWRARATDEAHCCQPAIRRLHARQVRGGASLFGLSSQPSSRLDSSRLASTEASSYDIARSRAKGAIPRATPAAPGRVWVCVGWKGACVCVGRVGARGAGAKGPAAHLAGMTPETDAAVLRCSPPTASGRQAAVHRIPIRTISHPAVNFELSVRWVMRTCWKSARRHE